MSSKRKIREEKMSKNDSKKLKETIDAIIEVIHQAKEEFDPETIKMESKELARAWAEVLIRFSYQYVFTGDGQDFDDICKTETFTFGPWMVIYQPTKDMKEWLDYIAAIIIRRVDKKPVTEKMLKDAASEIEEVNKLYLQSYNDVLAFTKGKWSHMTDGTLESVASMKEPLTVRDKVIKTKFEIRDSGEYCYVANWYPARLMKWAGKSLDGSPFDEEGTFKGTLDPETHLPEQYCFFKCTGVKATV